VSKIAVGIHYPPHSDVAITSMQVLFVIMNNKHSRHFPQQLVVDKKGQGQSVTFSV